MFTYPGICTFEFPVCYPMQVPPNCINHRDPSFCLAECVKPMWDVDVSTNRFVPRQLPLDPVRLVTIHRHLHQPLEVKDWLECIQLDHPIINSLLAPICRGSFVFGGLGIFVCLREEETLIFLTLIPFPGRTSKVTSTVWRKVRHVVHGARIQPWVLMSHPGSHANRSMTHLHNIFALTMPKVMLG